MKVCSIGVKGDNVTNLLKLFSFAHSPNFLIISLPAPLFLDHTV